MIQATVRELAPLVPSERIFVIETAHLRRTDARSTAADAAGRARSIADGRSRHLDAWRPPPSFFKIDPDATMVQLNCRPTT